MKWITRERPKIDRIAAKYRLDEPALARLASIVRGADTSRLAAQGVALAAAR